MPNLSGTRLRRQPPPSHDHAYLTAPLGDERTDRRIQRTRALLHEAIGSLMRERAYERITVAQILDRAKVSRSTFYTHFRDKDDLMMSSLRDLILGALSRQVSQSAEAAERATAFSLPLLQHIHQHRRSGGARLGERGRAILHEHLRQALAQWIAQAMKGDPRRGRPSRSAVAAELLARHVASTFVLVLHWWLDEDGASSPTEADRLFRSLVMPVLRPAQS